MAEPIGRGDKLTSVADAMRKHSVKHQDVKRESGGPYSDRAGQAGQFDRDHRKATATNTSVTTPATGTRATRPHHNSSEQWRPIA